MAKRNRKNQRANARKRKAAAKVRREAAAEAERRGAEINAALQEQSDEEFSRNFIQSAEERQAFRERLEAEERSEAIAAAMECENTRDYTTSDGSAPEEVPTLRNTIGLNNIPTNAMTREQTLANAERMGVPRELGLAADMLFGVNGPKPDDPLTPEQVKACHDLFDIVPNVPMLDQIAAMAALPPTAYNTPAEPEEAEEPEPLSCQICYKPYGPFRKPCGHMQQVQAFPEWEWQDRGCVCPTVEICMECVQKEAFESAVRCCVNPLCKGITMKCPWCREDVSIGDLFYKWVLSNGDRESQRRALATLAQEGLV